jgi:membrane-associated phospholipid phosphatase
MSHATELQIIERIHEYRTPALDAFFTFLNYFDRQEFLFVLIPTLWLVVGWKTGLRIYYILFLNNLVNHALKHYFASPRPFQLDASLGIIQVKGYGFPSGAAQTVMLLSCILLQNWKSPWRWPVAITYILFISFSRVYLGVHFPTDILAGWVVGFALWALYAYSQPRLEKQLKKWTAPQLFLLSGAVPLLLIGLQNTSSVISISGSAMGMGIGIFLNHTYGWFLPPSRTLKTSILRAVIGVGGIFACYYLLAIMPIPYMAKFMLLGLWTATGSTLVCRLFRHATRA